MEDHLDDQALEAVIDDCARRLRAWWQARWGGGDADPLDDADFDLDEQLVRGSFPLRIPLALEIYIAGDWIVCAIARLISLRRPGIGASST